MPHPSIRGCVRALAALAVFALALPLATAPGRAAEPYDIYAILSLTGPFAFLGTSEATALHTIEGIVNKQGGIRGRPVHFVIQDDSSQPAVAVQLADGILAKKVPVLLGPTYVASCLAVAPLVKADGPVQYCFAPTIHPPPGSYTFSASAASSDQAIESLVFAQDKGWKRIAMIGTTDATGQDIQAQFRAAFASGKFPKLKLVDSEQFSPADVSVAAQIAKIEAARPDAILVATVGTATGTVFRALKDAGSDTVPVISNLGNLLHVELDRFAAIIPKTIYFTAPRFIARDVSHKGPIRDAQLEFYRAFNTQGIDPDVGNNIAWDATMIVIDALRHVGPDATAKQVHAFIEGLHGYAGTDGIFDYRSGDQRGVGLTSLVMARWNPAKKTWETVSEPGGKPFK